MRIAHREERDTARLLLYWLGRPVADLDPPLVDGPFGPPAGSTEAGRLATFVLVECAAAHPARTSARPNATTRLRRPPAVPSQPRYCGGCHVTPQAQNPRRYAPPADSRRRPREPPRCSHRRRRPRARRRLSRRVADPPP